MEPIMKNEDKGANRHVETVQVGGVKNRNTQAPALDRYAESRSTRSPVGMVRARRILMPCFRAVERTERMVAKISAPARFRKPPEIFILTFIMRMSCSAWS